MAETKKQAAATATATEDKTVPARSDARAARAAERERRIKAGECVVDGGGEHVGRAVNGLVCSRHAVWYDAQGKRRS